MNYQTLEEAREKCAKKLKISIYIGLAFFIVATILVLAGIINPQASTSELGMNLIGKFMKIAVAAIMITCLFTIIAVLLTYKDRKTYKRLYKAYFVEKTLKNIFTDLKYNHESGMPKSVLESTGMINTGDIYSSNDYTSGKYKEVSFSQADVCIQEVTTDSEGHTQYDTIFKGRWMVFEFPKSFTFRLQVVEKWFGPSRKMRKDRNIKRKIERIHTESIEFDKKFKVYAEDGFEAYYILDPAFLQHIEDLSNTRKGKLMLCFIDNKLHVAIYDNKDAFEPPSPLKKLDEKSEFEKINHDIKTITDFVDFLNLDRKLFKQK